MKIFLLPSWYPSKEKPLDGIFFKEQAEALVKDDVEVVVINVVIKSLHDFGKEKNSGQLQCYTENGVKVYKYVTYNYFPKLTEFYLRYYGKTLYKVFNEVCKLEGNPDLVHIHSAIDVGIAYTKSKLKFPYVITEHSTKYARNILNDTQKKYLKDVFQGAKDIMVVGTGLKREISKYVSENRIKIMYNPVIMPEIKIEKDESKDKFRFFSLGLLSNKKGMDALIKAYNKYKKELESTELYIGGNGEEYNNLKSLIESYNLQENVHLLGALNRDEVSYHMKNCDCFTLASRFETFGIVFVEAMYYGKPVIGTRTGGPDSFVNDSCGILVDIDDIDAIGSAMVKIKNSYDNYDAEEIKKYCERNFSEKVIVNKVKNIYSEVIGEENDKRNDI
ncbi:MAG: glycosyltransferase [Clostridium sp.]|nr:glycosyltransferase [Clostridium sp.]